MKALHPTLWRTCRVLANPVRLRMLQAVLTQPGAYVSAVAKSCRVPLNTASTGLRALQARGLITARRVGPYVFYAPQTDADVRHADAVLTAISAALRRGDPIIGVMKVVTAFTHVRRITLVRTLDTKSGLLSGTLSQRCGISQPALRRHLAKLARRGMVASNKRHLWQVTVPPTPLGRALLSIARAS
jgi:DNA-binding transcriptional ArsR family regulator